jgi:hypothetical protein
MDEILPKSDTSNIKRPRLRRSLQLQEKTTMTYRILSAVLLAASLMNGQPASVKAEAQLESAIHEELVIGDLKGAIEQYKSILLRYDGNRAVAAVALLHLGECQSKMGHRGAANITYMRLLKEFPDQPAIANKGAVKLLGWVAAGARPQDHQSQSESEKPPKPAFGVGVATFPVEAAAGKHVTFSGYIRTEVISRGWAGLWWRVDSELGSRPLAFDNMEDRGPRGTTAWARYEIQLDAPANAKNINFGVLHAGDGTAWFDDLSIELDGVPYSDSKRFDLGFESESPPPRGFYTGGNGYKLELDKEIFHGGEQSLRSKFVPSTSNAGEGASRDKLSAVHSWKTGPSSERLTREIKQFKFTMIQSGFDLLSYGGSLL